MYYVKMSRRWSAGRKANAAQWDIQTVNLWCMMENAFKQDDVVSQGTRSTMRSVNNADAAKAAAGLYTASLKQSAGHKVPTSKKVVVRP